VTTRRGWAVLIALVLFGAYGYRAVSGVIAGRALVVGGHLYVIGYYVEAAAWLDRAAVGQNRLRATRDAAGARLDRWDTQVRRYGSLVADRALLTASADGFLRCRCLAPASRGSWEGLGEAYDGLEWVGREMRSFEPATLERDGWERVGRPGRVAVGMLREASELAPNWYQVQDKLALTLWSYGLEAEAREAVHAAARSLPLFHQHTFRKIPEIPEWFERTFAAASREAVDSTSLISRPTHTLDLGKLELRIGEFERAVTTLEQALNSRGDAVHRAEAHFNLGVALVSLDRFEEASPHLLASSGLPAFRLPALQALARGAEAAGRTEEAMDYLRALRAEEPREIAHCLELARLAGELEEWPAALAALRWARQTHPTDPRPHVAFIEAHVAMGDHAKAGALLREMEAIPEMQPELERLRTLVGGGRR